MSYKECSFLGTQVMRPAAAAVPIWHHCQSWHMACCHGSGLCSFSRPICNTMRSHLSCVAKPTGHLHRLASVLWTRCLRYFNIPRASCQLHCQHL